MPNDTTIHENIQFPNTNTSSGPKGWSTQEGLSLMYSWCRVSENAIVGANQNTQTFWRRVKDSYEEARADNSRFMGEERSIESLRQRQKRLNTNVTKWIGAYKEAYNQKRSGMSDADVEKIAQQFYAGPKGSKFVHHEVFEKIMQHHPKWELKLGVEIHRNRTERACVGDADGEEGSRSSKKSKTTDEDPTEVSEASTIHRPIGRDKAKGKRKEKTSSSTKSVVFYGYTSALEAMRITCEKEVAAINRMGDIKYRGQDVQMLKMLMSKSHLSPQEEAIKNRLQQELYSS